jgi:predicted Zn-dependent protease
MRQAGFDPAGAIRLQQKLADAGGTTLLPFLSTHPSGAERIDAMRRLAEGEPAQAPGSARTR